MNRSERKSDGGAVVAGVVLIAVGLVFLLDRLEIGVENIVHSWWPMLIVLWGVWQLSRCGRRWTGVWMIAVGGWLQAVQMHLYGLTMHNSWPILLIIFGAGLTGRAIADAFVPRTKEERHEP